MKTKSILWVAALFFSFLLSNTSNATHLLGGEIRWECHPTNGKYRIVSKLYGECSNGPVSFSNSMAITLSNGNPNVTANFVSSYQINPSCYDPSSSYSCNSSYGAFEVGVFKSAWVTINNIPVTGLELFWSQCCRSPAPANLVSIDLALRAMMYPTGGGGLCNNSSPIFLEEPLVRACTGVQLNFSPIAMDVDNDSLFVKLASAINPYGANMVYKTGYSATNPFPDANIHSSNIPLSLNSSTGEMSFNSYTNGTFVGVYEIEEWRQGALISRTFRDAPTIIGNCMIPTGTCPQVSNTAPSLIIQTDTFQFPNSPKVIAISPLEFEINASVGDTINSNITSFDLGYNQNCLPQTVELTAFGLQLSSDTAYSNPSACVLNGPCATLTSQNTGGGFISPTFNSVAFQWEINSAHLTYQGLQTQKVTQVFYLTVSDNACPIPGTVTATLKVNIESNLPSPPSLSQSCLNIVASSGDINFSASPASDTSNSFQGYYVYHATNLMGPYLVIDTLTNYALTGYTDAGRGPGANYYYLRTASTMLSHSSDTLSLMNLNIIPPTAGPAFITLNWNAYSSNINPNMYYQIWYRQNFSAPWLLIDSTQSLTYIHTPPAIVAGLDYKIAIGGTCFSSKTNAIGIEEAFLKKVTVSPVPFKEDLTITLPEELDITQMRFELFNIAGQKIAFKSENLTPNEIRIIGLKDLPSGVYILHLTANSKTKSFKLIH